MELSKQLQLSQEDYQQISSLLGQATTDISELLEEELNRAIVVPLKILPEDVVSMNCEVRFTDLETKKESVVTLVYPHEADIKANKISVFSPVGAALIGLQVGQSIDWPLRPDHFKKLKVLSVKRPD